MLANCHDICDPQVPTFLSSISSKLSSWQVQGFIFWRKKYSLNFFFANLIFLWSASPTARRSAGWRRRRAPMSFVTGASKFPLPFHLLTYWKLPLPIATPVFFFMFEMTNDHVGAEDVLYLLNHCLSLLHLVQKMPALPPWLSRGHVQVLSKQVAHTE